MIHVPAIKNAMLAMIEASPSNFSQPDVANATENAPNQRVKKPTKKRTTTVKDFAHQRAVRETLTTGLEPGSEPGNVGALLGATPRCLDDHWRPGLAHDRNEKMLVDHPVAQVGVTIPPAVERVSGIVAMDEIDPAGRRT